MEKENINDQIRGGVAQKSPRTLWNEKNKTNPRVIDWNRPWYYYAKKLIQATGMSSGRALDVGCGLGEFMAQLKEMGFDVNGIDGGPEQVRQVRQAGFEASVTNFENPLPAVDASFDLITCLEVIEHVALAESLLKEMSRILTVDGYIVLSTPNFSCWQNRIRYLFGSGPVNEGIHLRFFTQKRLKEAMMQAGLEIVGRASFGPFTGVNFLLRKFGRRPKKWIVSRNIEGLFAEHFVYLGKKTR